MTTAREHASADLTELKRRVAPGQREGHFHVALFGLRKYDALSVVSRIERGLTYAAFERFQRNTELSFRVLAQAAEIPERTLARRKEAGRFEPSETDRLMRTSRIVARAIELFDGSVASARQWLTSPVAAFGGRAPIEFAATDVGTIEVENVIGRLMHGIPT